MKLYDKFGQIIFTCIGSLHEVSDEQSVEIERALENLCNSLPKRLNTEVSDACIDKIWARYLDKTYEVHEAAQYIDYLIRKSRWQSALLLFACFLGLTSSIVALLTVNGVL